MTGGGRHELPCRERPALGRPEGDGRVELVGGEAADEVGQQRAVAAQLPDGVGPAHAGEGAGVAGVVGVDPRRRLGDGLAPAGPAQPVEQEQMPGGDVVDHHAHRPALALDHGRPLPVGTGLGEGDGLLVGRLQGPGRVLHLGAHDAPPSGTTATVTSISTAPPRGSAATPMADRVWRPASPKMAKRTRLAPSTTVGWSWKSGVEATYPVTVSTRSTRSSVPRASSSTASAFRAHTSAAAAPASTPTSSPNVPVQVSFPSIRGSWPDVRA